MAKKWEERTYTIGAYSEQFKEIESLLSYIEDLGYIGHSTTFKVFVDGDGAARIRVCSNKGKDILKINNNKEILKNKLDDHYEIKTSFCID